jgi:hypothetical protein
VKRLRAFGHFWYDFVVGDDWRLALASAFALGACGLLTHLGVASWWPLPVVVAGSLTLTLMRLSPPVDLPRGDSVQTTSVSQPLTEVEE